ncbi:hypothetical protein FO519_010077 [Halicephalobus sp. NKZ332]|nr:hypothetical protein FO519_010077 [Halicephalobus sp. NKZ332]
MQDDTKEKFVLTVADVFQHPSLTAMAEHMVECSERKVSDFQKQKVSERLYGSNVDQQSHVKEQLIKELSHLSIHMERVEDIYPASPVQHGMLVEMEKSTQQTNYLSQLKYEINGEIDIAAFQQAWQQFYHLSNPSNCVEDIRL